MLNDFSKPDNSLQMYLKISTSACRQKTTVVKNTTPKKETIINYFLFFVNIFFISF